LGYEVQVPFDEDLRRTVAWHKQSVKTGKQQHANGQFFKRLASRISCCTMGLRKND
jgi:hypothetical protein